jgi:antitoxin component of RelBE/YafQ-DinJ toxin-antitoxin module
MSTKDKPKRLEVRIQPAMAKALNVTAKRLGVSVSDTVRLAVTQFIGNGDEKIAELMQQSEASGEVQDG